MSRIFLKKSPIFSRFLENSPEFSSILTCNVQMY